jgi:hypothetical protein
MRPMTKLSDLSPDVLQRLRSFRWDRIIEKHEGPEDWERVFSYMNPEFIRIDGRDVLLPVDREHHPNIMVLRCIVSDDGQNLTLFLKDTTLVSDPRWEHFLAGFVAVCDRFPGEDFFVAIMYHECFIIEKESAPAQKTE